MLPLGLNVDMQSFRGNVVVDYPVMALRSVQQLLNRFICVLIVVGVFFVVIWLLGVEFVPGQEVHQLVLGRVLHGEVECCSILTTPLGELGDLLKVLDLIEFTQFVDLGRGQPNCPRSVGLDQFFGICPLKGGF